MARPFGRGRRSLLWIWLVLSLVTVAYSALLFFTSAPVGAANAEAMKHGTTAPLSATDRFFALPIDKPRDVATATNASGTVTLGLPGDVLSYFPNGTTPGSGFLPLAPSGSTLARAIAYVKWNANESAYDVPSSSLRNVTHLTNATLNLSVDLTRYGHAEGFLVRADANADPEPALIPLANVAGKVVHTLPAGSVYLALVLSVLGTAAPLILIIVTHQGRGVAGVPGVVEGVCPECGRPLAPGLDFCAACGATLRPRTPP